MVPLVCLPFGFVGSLVIVYCGKGMVVWVGDEIKLW